MTETKNRTSRIQSTPKRTNNGTNHSTTLREHAGQLLSPDKAVSCDARVSTPEKRSKSRLFAHVPPGPVTTAARA